MTQLNLLPDIKLDYIKARQRKRMVVGTSIVISAFFVIIFVLMFVFVRFAQKEHLSNLDKDIAKTTQELQSKEDLDKILTIQSQLNSLPALHDQKTISSRLFDYLSLLTPSQATISNVNLDFVENTVSLGGNADQISTVNKFVDTLKFTGFVTIEDGVDPSQTQCTLQEISVQGVSSDNGSKICRAFSEVVLEEFSVETDTSSQGKKPVSYQIRLKFDPKIFANFKSSSEQPIALKIPNIISTRSATEKPGALFVPDQQQNNGESQ